MVMYKIFAGLSGGFGGAVHFDTLEFADKYEAVEFARDCAIEVYQQYEGSYGLPTLQDIAESIMNEEDITEEELNDYAVESMYEDEMDMWLDYYIEEVEEGESKYDTI